MWHSSTGGKLHLYLRLPLRPSLLLQQILVMPVARILHSRMRHYPGQGDSTCLTIGQREKACPDLVPKGFTCASRLPAILRPQYTVRRRIDTEIVAIER